MDLISMAALKPAGATFTDEYWENVVLLLNQVNSDGADNNAFVDDSSSAHTITAAGDATQGTFSPFSPNGFSMFFDGVDDYFTVADAAALRAGTGDFTLEAWVTPYSRTGANFNWIFGKTASTNGFAFGINTSNKWQYNNNAFAFITSTNTVDYWERVHVALCRASGTTRMFINGTQTGSSFADNRNWSDTSSVGVGRDANGSFEEFNGVIHGLRFVVGTALYTTTFTPPTSELTAVTNTQLLVCQYNRHLDGSSANRAITVASLSGTPKVIAGSPFPSTVPWTAASHGGSGYFDGTGDYLSIADNADFTQNTDYTFDAWVYPTAQGGNGGFSHTVYSHHNAATNQRSFEVRQRIGSWYAVLSTDGLAQTDMSGTSTPILNAWTHIRVTYDGTTHRLYINGVNEGSAVLGSLHDSTEPALIGDGGSDPFAGYISSVRLIVGTALTTGTGSFTPPTAPPTAVTDTKLLVNFTNAGIYDASAKHNITLTGNTKTDTGVVKFAAASVELDGTGDTAATRATEVLDLGPAYTVEFWTYLDSLANEARFFRYISGGVTYGAIEGGGGAGGSNTDLQIQRFGTGVRLNGSGALSTGTWIHVAVTYDGTTSTLWINGTSADTYIGNVFPGASAQIILGDANSIDGRIEDFRVTAGVQRYTAAFTPPDRSFPKSG